MRSIFESDLQQQLCCSKIAAFFFCFRRITILRVDIKLKFTGK